MSNINPIPKDEGIDHSISLLKEGYLFISNRRDRFHSPIFETRLLGKKAICISGKEAAELFYDNKKFKRKDALPNKVVKTFFGENSVITLDGDAHKKRKEMFMSVMTPDDIKRLTEIADQQWAMVIDNWRQQEQVVLYEETQEILCKTACEWTGVPVPKDQIEQLTKDLVSMFESPATVGLSSLFTKNARNRVEKWFCELIDSIQEGKVVVDENTILHKFAMYRDAEDNRIDTETAAVEILNILTPIVAISIFINFLAHAIHLYPNMKRKLEDHEEYTQMFIQEVRRFYPFMPFVAALVKEDFIWNDYQFEKDTLTLLDLYGTNHDPKVWENPNLFYPERFADWKGSPFEFIPQGGGDYFLGHRCAGEWATNELLKVSLDYLVNKLDYEFPDQDFSFSLGSMPSIPKSKVILQNVRPKIKI